MLYPTLNQPIVFLALFAAGLAGGFLFDGANLLTILCNKNRFAKEFFYFVCVVINAIVFYFVNLTLNYGSFRFFTILTFILAILVQRLIFGKLFAKIYKKCYNKFNARRKKEKNP